MTEQELVIAADQIKALAARMECVSTHRNNILKIDRCAREFVRGMSPIGIGMTDYDMQVLVNDAILLGLTAEFERCRNAIQATARLMSGTDAPVEPEPAEPAECPALPPALIVAEIERRQRIAKGDSDGH